MNIQKLLLALLFIICALFYSCDTSEPNNDKPDQPGYQEEIPWASLSSSPWPMLHRNPQATGRGNSLIDNIGQVQWEFNFSQEGEDLVSGVVVGSDSSIYFLTEMHYSAGLYCIDHSGNEKWKVELGSAHRFTTPIVNMNNNILILDYNTLKSFNNNGQLLWSYSFNNSLFWVETPQIDTYRNIYLIDNLKNLYKLSPSGNLEWQINNPNFKSTAGTFGMAFSPNGKILYIPGENKSLLAINIETQELLWDYGQQSMMTSPIVDNQGNIYCQLNDKIISLNPAGQLRWDYAYAEFTVNDNKPTIDKNGNIFFASKDSLYSLDFNGNFRWSNVLTNSTDSPLICDDNGNIYVGFFNGGLSLIKYNNEGQEIWEIDFNTNGQQIQLYSSPIISFNNTIIFPTEKKIFALK